MTLLMIMTAMTVMMTKTMVMMDGDDDDEDFPRGSHTGTSATSQRWKSALSQLRSKAETGRIVLLFKSK